jgi:hypothetical protein
VNVNKSSIRGYMVLLSCALLAVVWQTVSAGESLAQSENKIKVAFDRPIENYRSGDSATIVMTSERDCHLYLFNIDEQNHVTVLYPQPGSDSLVRSSEPIIINRVGSFILRVNKKAEKLHAVSLISDRPLVEGSDWSENCNPAITPLTIDGNELMARISAAAKAEPNKVVHIVMDAPRAL